MSNAIYMVGVATICDTLRGVPWWVIAFLVAIGVFADLFAFCDQNQRK